jgi:hypothetical protein
VILGQINGVTVEEQGEVGNSVGIERVDDGPRRCLKMAVRFVVDFWWILWGGRRRVGGGDLRLRGEDMVGAKMGQGTCLAQGVFI